MRDELRGFTDATTKHLPLTGQSASYYEGYDRGLRDLFARLRIQVLWIRINHTVSALSSST